MLFLFFVAAAIAVASTLMVITRANGVHALLYLVVSLLSVSFVFYILGAPFAAALEIIVYAGAIMVLFVFVIMMLNIGGREEQREETRLLAPGMWKGPSFLALILLIELLYAVDRGMATSAPGPSLVGPTQVGKALFGPYVIAVETASFLLLAGLVGAYHLGRRETGEP